MRMMERWMRLLRPLNNSFESELKLIESNDNDGHTQKTKKERIQKEILVEWDIWDYH